MNKIITRFFNHLMRRRFLIWAVTLLLISGLAASLGALLWTARMNVSYPAEISPGGGDRRERTVTVTIPATAFQSIRKGAPATITTDGGSRLKGIVSSVITGREETKLTIAVSGMPEETTEGVITLRAERLISAFLHR